MKQFFLFPTLLVTPLALAGGMNHIDPIGADLVSTPANGRIQVFLDTPNLSRMVIDDFFADGPMMDSASMAVELFIGDIERPDVWRITVWNRCDPHRLRGCLAVKSLSGSTNQEE